MWPHSRRHRRGFFDSRDGSVVELYTFLKMGGQLDRVKVIGLVGAVEQGEEANVIGTAGGMAHGMDDLQKGFATFKARNSRCFLSADRERLLAVIEAGFGVLDDFDLLVRHLLSTRRSLSMEKAQVEQGLSMVEIVQPATEIMHTQSRA